MYLERSGLHPVSRIISNKTQDLLIAIIAVLGIIYLASKAVSIHGGR